MIHTLSTAIHDLTKVVQSHEERLLCIRYELDAVMKATWSHLLQNCPDPMKVAQELMVEAGKRYQESLYHVEQSDPQMAAALASHPTTWQWLLEWQ